MPRKSFRPRSWSGFLLEVLKYINLLTWPYLRMKLALEYGPFVYSITIILWGFLAAMVVLAGAEWAARRSRIRIEEPTGYRALIRNQALRLATEEFNLGKKGPSSY